MTEDKILPFEQAREFVHSLKLKKEKDWWDYCSYGRKPSNIPFAPWRAYKDQWKDWNDWLGIKIEPKFLSFEKALQHVRTLGLQNFQEWREFCKSGNKSNNIPANPNLFYKKEWNGWGDWLGTGKTRPKRIDELLPFKQARDYVRSLNLKTTLEWQKFCKSGKKPSNIPTTPNNVYWKDWKGWRDWLKHSNIEGLHVDFGGLENEMTTALDEAIAKWGSKYLPFEQAREFVHLLKIKGQKEWWNYCKSGKKPSYIPTAPHRVYREKWEGFGDWLGIEKSEFLPFEQAREFVHSLGIKGQKEWLEFCKSGKKPSNIPTSPYMVYKNEWKGFGDWLGTGRSRSRKFMPFEQARNFVSSFNLSGVKEWQEFCKSGKKPHDIPYAPDQMYWEEWNGWKDWLGISQYMPFKEAKQYARSLKLKNKFEWDAFCKSSRKPKNIPANPWRTYKNEWKGLADWLGNI